MIRVADLLAGAGAKAPEQGKAGSGFLGSSPASRRGPNGLPLFVRVRGVGAGRVIDANSTAALVRLGDTPELEGRNDWLLEHYPGHTPAEWVERWFPLRVLAPC